MDVFDNYECDGQMTITDYLKTRKGEEMTVSEIFEEIKTEMCDKRCKIPNIYKAVNEDKDTFYEQMYGDLIDIELCDSDYCRNCPLNKL